MRRLACSLFLALLMPHAVVPAEGRPQPSFPIKQKMGDGKNTGEVYLSQVRNTAVQSAWCYRVAHPKGFYLQMTVIRGSEEKPEAYPKLPLEILTKLTSDQRLRPGRVVDIAPIGPAKLTKALLVEADPLKDVPKANALTLVPLYPNEVQVAETYGWSRLQASLASQSRYYPCPVWFDPKRASVFLAQQMEQLEKSPLRRLPVMESHDSIVVHEQAASLSLSFETGKRVANAIGDRGPKGFRVALEPDPRSDAFLVWHPVDTPPQAVKANEAPGSHISGQFVAFVSGHKVDEVLLVEDGYVFLLTTPTALRLANELENGLNTQLKLDGAFSQLVVDWKDKVIRNPVDGTSYKSDSGFVRYGPIIKEKAQGPHLSGIVLLTPDQELAKAATVDALTEWIRSVEKASLPFVGDLGTGEYAIQCQLTPQGAECVIAIKNPTEGQGSKVQEWHAALKALKAPSVKGPVKFLLNFVNRP